MDGDFADQTGGVFAVFFGLVQKQERKIRQKDDAAVYEHVGSAGNSEYPPDKVDRLRNVGEKKEPPADSEEHQKMERVEFLPPRYVERDDENDDSRYREKNLEKVHGLLMAKLRTCQLYPGARESQKFAKVRIS